MIVVEFIENHPPPDDETGRIMTSGPSTSTVWFVSEAGPAPPLSWQQDNHRRAVRVL
jgi:hypothetical protein